MVKGGFRTKPESKGLIATTWRNARAERACVSIVEQGMGMLKNIDRWGKAVTRTSR